MTHSDLVRIEVQGADILVAMRGTCFRVKYRKQEAPWLMRRNTGPTTLTRRSRSPNFERLHGLRLTTKLVSWVGSLR